jgi:hypothetical protein
VSYYACAVIPEEAVTPENLKHQADTLELIHAELSARLDRLSDGAAKVDNKAIVLIGYAGAAASFLATRKPEFVLAALAYVAYAVAAVFGIFASAARNYQDPIREPGFPGGYLGKSKPAALLRLVYWQVKALEHNRKYQIGKVRLWWISLAALAVGMVLMVASLVVLNPHS